MDEYEQSCEEEYKDIKNLQERKEKIKQCKDQRDPVFNARVGGLAEDIILKDLKAFFEENDYWVSNLNKNYLGEKFVELVAGKPTCKKEIAVDILDTKKRQSKIVFKTNDFFVDKFGLYTQYNKILFGGYLSEKKLADMLPSDYNME